MLDVQLLRARLDFVAERLATRGMSLDAAAFQALEDERKTRQTRTQDLQARRNALSKQVGQLKGKGEDASAVLAEVAGIGDELKANEVALAELLERKVGRRQRRGQPLGHARQLRLRGARPRGYRHPSGRPGF